MDYGEFIKRLKRSLDWNFLSRRSLLYILIFLLLLLYLGPILLRRFSLISLSVPKETLNRVLQFHLDDYVLDAQNFDLHVRHSPLIEGEKPFIAYVGNGYIGLEVNVESFIMIKTGRTLSLPVKYRPVVLLSLKDQFSEEALVTHYKSGIVERIQVWRAPSGEPLKIIYRSYVHRTKPSIFIQDIKVINPTDFDLTFNINRLGSKHWDSLTSKVVSIDHGKEEHDYLIFSGALSLGHSNSVVPICIATLKLPSSIEVKRKFSTSLHIITSVNYSESVERSEFNRGLVDSEVGALESLKEIVMSSAENVQAAHTTIWNVLWKSGFSISHSKAENAINGDLINATIYSVLSQTRAFLHETKTRMNEKLELSKTLAYSESCYDGHQTLQATTLWSNLDSLDEVNKVVSLWLMTLEKQGCHQLLRAGSDGTLQAMILSFGSFQFSDQHLEFNADPSHLHRDYFFRRIHYGLKTHINVSVTVQEDYKAVLSLAIDRSDKKYYGCDAGCLDPPVQLGTHPSIFPVKKTDPLTAILYITSDKLHMIELKHTIHVREIAIAPAHEHHVIAVHRHGHKWAGLPSVFWLAIVALIVVFHLFLFKIVVNEYCGPEVRMKYRKLSDFE